MTETWKPIPGFPGYDVSDCGRVRSYRTRMIGNGKRWHIADTPQRYLRPGLNTSGYPQVILSPGQMWLVHRLVMLIFLDPPAATHLQANHKNGLKTDNRLDNLEWVTQSENMQHSYQELGRTTPRGEQNCRAKLDWNRVHIIRAMYQTGNYTGPELAQQFGVHRNSIYNVVTCKTWKETP